MLSNRPLLYLYLARGLRDFGDSFVAVLLPVYLAALGLSTVQIGVVATAALAGSALMTLGIGALGSRYDHRNLLLGCSALMLASGLAFCFVHDYAVVAIVAFAGTINPSAGNTSIFVPLEHAVLSREAADGERTTAFSRYGLIGMLCNALGALAAALPDFAGSVGLTQLAGLKAMFVLYGLLGILGAYLYSLIPLRQAGEQHRPGPLGPSKRVVYKLAALFGLDAFAGGFTVQSLLALWLFTRFDMSLSAASLFFFWSVLLSAVSIPVAAWLARRIGLVNTMVFTHVPSSLAVIFAAFAPSLNWALFFLVIRAALSQMDVPARSSYVMAVVTPPERAAAAAATSAPRSLASAASPSISGVLLAGAFPGAPLVIGGGLKIVYDILLLAQFRHVKPPEELR